MSPSFPTLADLTDARSLRAIHDDRLRAVLTAARSAPFYAQRLSRARIDAFHEIPFLTKPDLREAYPFGLLAVDRGRIATYHESTGTTGEPTSSYFTESDWDDVASRFARSAVGMTSSDAVLVKTPYAMVTTAHQMHRAARLCGAMVIPADNRSGNMSYPRVVRLLRDIPVTVTWSMPTEGLLWAAAAWRAGVDPQHDFPRLRALVVAGEPVSFAKRRRIGELWGGAHVYEDYGSTETGSLAGECTHGALHLWADRFYFELLDPRTGAVRSEGRGELVVTSLFREAMPLVRYRLEDVVEVSAAPCPCGWKLPTVRVCGRSSAALSIAGRPLFPVDLEAAVFSLPLQRRVLFWRARCEPRTIEIEIEVASGHESEACRELEDRVFAATDVRAHVVAVPPGSIVPDALLTSMGGAFRKPRFVFQAHEDWSTAVAY
jgi:phenylacetate-CoA ligase